MNMTAYLYLAVFGYIGIALAGVYGISVIAIVMAQEFVKRLRGD